MLMRQARIKERVEWLCISIFSIKSTSIIKKSRWMISSGRISKWRKEECERLYENAQADYEYYTCDNYIRTELEEGNYEFLADGTDF